MNSPRIIGVYLGAGRSRRMGQNKLELPFGELCLGSWGLRAAIESELDWIIAVTRKGDGLQWLAPFSKKKGWGCLCCEKADEGQSASLKAGVKAAMVMGADAVVVMLADQPFVDCLLLNRLVKGFRESSDRAFVAAALQPPVLLANKMVADVFRLEGDRGAGCLLRGKWRKQGKVIGLRDRLCLLDIDTVEEYEIYRGEGWMCE
ncbi:NTP transferase domain-containing protein [Neobacillus sp. SM06]|uniref:NTP transferase domain-containing protein n=1 Tax=Neobacillus sp. SM06 TaxID=3422492 RepID=UPI003D2B5BF3